MKNVILSADGDYKVYSVPDKVSDDLEKYCLEFEKWLYTSPEGEKYYLKQYGMFAYDESDFIEWLNKYKFPNQISFFVENLGNICWKDIPERCKEYPDFNF